MGFLNTRSLWHQNPGKLFYSWKGRSLGTGLYIGLHTVNFFFCLRNSKVKFPYLSRLSFSTCEKEIVVRSDKGAFLISFQWIAEMSKVLVTPLLYGKLSYLSVGKHTWLFVGNWGGCSRICGWNLPRQRQSERERERKRENMNECLPCED